MISMEASLRGDGPVKLSKAEDVNSDEVSAVGAVTASDTDSDDLVLTRRVEDDVESEPDSEGTSTSSDETSSSSDEDESGSDEEVGADDSAQPPADLKTRLAAFLPQLAKADKRLSGSERVDDVGDDEERYIEMNLGLGVLAEKQGDGKDVRTKESESESSSDAGFGETMLPDAANTQKQPQKKRKIEEVS